MIKKVRNKYFNITFVFQHRWEKGLIGKTIFKTLKLGVWYNKHNVVGSKGFSNPKNWSKNSIKEHQFGAWLIVAKAWIEVSKAGIMEMDIDI